MASIYKRITSGSSSSSVSSDVNVISSVLPSGASTSANQVTGNSSLSSIDSKLTTIIGELNSASSINYSESSSVASGVAQTILSYTIPANSKLHLISVSGTQFAEFQVKLNGAVIDKARAFIHLNHDFRFKGLQVSAADVVAVEVLHNRQGTGDFNAKIITEVL